MIRLWKKYYLYATAITWGVYFFIWLCVMFVKFETVNPFYYFVELPNMKDGERGMFLLGVLGVELAKIVYSRLYTDHKLSQLDEPNKH